jgi:hypothetical protein
MSIGCSPTGKVSTLLGRGTPSTSRVAVVSSMLLSSDGSSFLSTGGALDNVIRRYDVATCVVSTVAGDDSGKDTDGDALTASVHSPRSLVYDLTSQVPDSVVYFATPNRVRRLNLDVCTAVCLFFSLPYQG